jgi:Flp pilus assembly protein protease CpaA
MGRVTRLLTAVKDLVNTPVQLISVVQAVVDPCRDLLRMSNKVTAVLTVYQQVAATAGHSND